MRKLAVIGRVARRWLGCPGTLRIAAALLDRHPWCGDELVLHIGCERGLATIAAARRLCSGHVVGLDTSHAPSSNSQAAAANAVAAACRSRVSFRAGDATTLPFADGTFDVVVTMAAFQTLGRTGRARAVREALRVLCPGGTLLIFDILHTRSYAAAAATVGGQAIRRSPPSWLRAFPGWSLAVQKPPSP